ncbi:uncharacterized protein LOC144656420 [Oculina patagonica]
MAERNLTYCKLGYHDNVSRSVPSVSPPVLLSEEAQHLVYVFCDRENSIRSQKHRYQRRYCSLCRHFHQETEYKDGFEKYFRRENSKNNITGKNQQGKVNWTSQGDASGLKTNSAPVSVERNWKTLSVEGLKMYIVNGKTNQKSLSRKPGFEKEGDLHGKEESEKKHLSTRSGCKVCMKRIDSQEDNKSKKKIIKIVVPPFE